MASRSRKSARLASAFSTIASTTRPQPAASSSRAARADPGGDGLRLRGRRACPWRRGRRASPPASRSAACAAPSRASKSRTGWPACAATWAMPAPMMPAPTTKTGVSERSSNAMAVAVRYEATPRGSGASELSASRGSESPPGEASSRAAQAACAGAEVGRARRASASAAAARTTSPTTMIAGRAEALVRDDRGKRVEATDRVPLPGQAGVLDDRDRRGAGEAAREPGLQRLGGRDAHVDDDGDAAPPRRRRCSASRSRPRASRFARGR